MSFAAIATFATPALSAPAFPENFVVEGRLYNSSGAPLAAAVDIELEVYAEGAPTCVLYREIHQNVNVDSATNNNNDGIFAIKLGAGTSKPGDFATVQLSRIFSNSVGLNGDSNDDNSISADCTRSTSNLTSAARFVRVSVKLTSDVTYDVLSPDTVITSVPSAMVAETLQGRDASGFAQIQDDAANDLSQANLLNVFSAVNYPKLVNLLSGNQNNQTLSNLGAPSAATDAATKGYTDANIGGRVADVSAVGPATGNGQTLIWDQAGNRWVTGTPSSTDATKLPLAGGTMTGAIAMGAQNITNIGHMTMASQRTLNLGTYTNAQEAGLIAGLAAGDKGKIWYNTDDNVFKAWDGSAAVKQAGLDASDRIQAAWIPNTGVTAATYGSATSVPVFSVGSDGRITGVSNTAISMSPSGAAGGDLTGTYPNPTIASNAVGTAEIANDSITAAKINTTGGGMGRLLITDGTGTGVGFINCSPNEVLKWTVTGWACFADNVNPGTITAVNAGTGLTGGGTSGSVTLNVNTGTSANQIVALDASSRLPAVDGSQLTAVNATAIGTRPVSATPPIDAQVLTWNNTTSVWEPRHAVAATTLLVSDGTAASPSISFQNSNTSGLYRSGANVIGVSIAGVSSFQFAGNGFASTTNFGPNLNPGTTASLPAYTFLGDPDTGMYRFAADTLAFSTGGTERMRISTNGNLSIGSTATTHRLNVDAGSGADVGAAIFRANGTTSVKLAVGNSNSGSKNTELLFRGGTSLSNQFGVGVDSTQTNTHDFYIYDYFGGTRLLIDNVGNIGVGTSSPGAKLDVNGDIRATAICDETGANCKDISTGWTSDPLPSGQIFVGSGSNIAIARTLSGDATISNIGVLTINNDAVGTSKIVDNSVTGAKIPTGAIGATHLAPGIGVWSEASGNVSRSSGNVGIGTTTPGFALVVGANAGWSSQIAEFNGTVTIKNNGTGSPTTLALDNLNGGNTGTALQFRGNSSGSPRNAARIRADQAGGNGTLAFEVASGNILNEMMRITQNGDVGIGEFSPRGTLDVNGTILGKAAVVNAGATINFATGNTQFTTASCGPFNLYNLKDGGSYIFAVKGPTSSTCTFSAFSDAGVSSLTFHYPTGHGATVAATHTLYRFVVVGGDVYASWSPGI